MRTAKQTYTGLGYRMDKTIWLVADQAPQKDGVHLILARYIGKTRITAETVLSEDKLIKEDEA
jgi:hypothetical protein